MGFQAPFEIAQSQLERLRFSSVEAREAEGGIFPFFDWEGTVRFLVIDTSTSRRADKQGGQWVVEEFPLEIRFKKAIYPRPILDYRPFSELEPEALGGLFYFDGRAALGSEAALPESFLAALSSQNLARRARGKESLRDLFFTLDLRRLTGGMSRSGLFLRRRMELAALRSFIQETTAAGA